MDVFDNIDVPLPDRLPGSLEVLHILQAPSKSDFGSLLGPLYDLLRRHPSYFLQLREIPIEVPHAQDISALEGEVDACEFRPRKFGGRYQHVLLWKPDWREHRSEKGSVALEQGLERFEPADPPRWSSAFEEPSD